MNDAELAAAKVESIKLLVFGALVGLALWYAGVRLIKNGLPTLEIQ